MNLYTSFLLGLLYIGKRPARISVCINDLTGYGFTHFYIWPVVVFIYFSQIFANPFFFFFTVPHVFTSSLKRDRHSTA